MGIQRYFIVLVASSAFFFSLCFPGLTQTPGAATAPPSADGGIEKKIHDYILAHPEVLMQSLRMAKVREDEQWRAFTKTLITSFKKDLVDDPNAPVLGNPAGDATIVEFFDYRCPYCRQVEPFLQALLKNDPKLRIVEKEFPILGPASVFAARVALVAYKQGKHKQFRDALLAKKPHLDEADILAVAAQVGLNVDQIKVDINKPEVDAEIRRNFQIARELKLNGTPAFIVGTELVPGATDLTTLEAMLDDARHGSN